MSALLLAALAPAFHLAAQATHSSVKLTESMEGGLHGYISMKVSAPAGNFNAGVSFYTAIWPLLAKPLKSFQIGLPGTWVIPDNRGYQQPLCPHGTLARDNWPQRGPSYRDVFQTIEGSGGSWTSTKFPSTTPKYRMNGTPDCYNDEISSPGWGFYSGTALSPEKMGLAQITNHLVIPPDGLTFQRGMHGELFGSAWMALPLMDAKAAYHRQPTGDQSWTLFLNAQNFKGPVAYWIPDTWSAISNGYPPAAGRTLDIRPGLMDGGAMEVNTVPYFSNKDDHGVLYSRIPRLLFPVDASNTTVFMQDVRMYSRDALYNSVKAWSGSSSVVAGTFDPRGTMTPSCKNEPLKFDQQTVPMTGFDAFVETTMVGRSGSCSFGLKWKRSAVGFPQYFKQDGGKLVAVPASQVPPETGLANQTFAPAAVGEPYTSPEGPGTVWSNPGPRSGPFTILLTDGSRVTYSWYRFVDQPALQHLHLSEADKARLQAIVERIQANWPITRNYIAPPSSGTLATLDPALIVTPPRGMEVGYVPIVIRQELAPAPNR
jgi:hypothetical protein